MPNGYERRDIFTVLRASVAVGASCTVVPATAAHFHNVVRSVRGFSFYGSTFLLNGMLIIL
jgi:hypothetical protein